MARDRYTAYSSDIIYAGPTTLTLRQLLGFSINPGQAFDETTPAGAVDRAAVILGMADPSADIMTHDLATILAVVSATAGLSCTGGLVLRGNHRAPASTFANTTGVTFVSTAGFLYPQAISASQGNSPAVLSLLYKAFSSDGLTAPFAANKTVDISGASAPAFVSKYFMGPVYFGATQIAGILSHSVDFGFEITPAFDSGDVYAQTCYIVKRSPRFTFTTTDLSWVNTRANINIADLGSALKVYYLNGVSAASRTALASAAHTKFTASTGVDHVSSISAQDNGDGTATVGVILTGTLGMSIASAVP